jgi:hypothetical protein
MYTDILSKYQYVHQTNVSDGALLWIGGFATGDKKVQTLQYKDFGSSNQVFMASYRFNSANSAYYMVINLTANAPTTSAIYKDVMDTSCD